jgi:uncharacterized protein (DUF1810 family)
LCTEHDESSDPYDLRRFVDAQAGSYAQALSELRSGRKYSHWMWYVFPQYEGLGHSPMARRYSIKSVAEARAYLAHPILGARLVECAEAILAIEGRSAHEIFGSPDDAKLCSSATLFSRVAESRSPFHRVLEKFFDGVGDGRTLELIGGGGC